MPENEKLPPPVNLKRRLIGAVVLVSAAVILVPLILSEREPPAELNTVSDISAKDAAPVSAPAPEQKPATTSAAKVPADTAKPSKGWVVQVGIFANAGNAARLSERLKQQGHDVLLDSISQNNEKRTRLRVGPFADKDAAQRAQAKIQQQAGVAGAVVTYP
ncbi:MAG: SPOR domain-containing protein [Pseudomonadota bacterium]